MVRKAPTGVRRLHIALGDLRHLVAVVNHSGAPSHIHVGSTLDHHNLGQHHVNCHLQLISVVHVQSVYERVDELGPEGNYHHKQQHTWYLRKKSCDSRPCLWVILVHTHPGDGTISAGAISQGLRELTPSSLRAYMLAKRRAGPTIYNASNLRPSRCSRNAASCSQGSGCS